MPHVSGCLPSLTLVGCWVLWLSMWPKQDHYMWHKISLHWAHRHKNRNQAIPPPHPLPPTPATCLLLQEANLQTLPIPAVSGGFAPGLPVSELLMQWQETAWPLASALVEPHCDLRTACSPHCLLSHTLLLWGWVLYPCTTWKPVDSISGEWIYKYQTPEKLAAWTCRYQST